MSVSFGPQPPATLRILNKSSRNCLKKINVVFLKYNEKGNEDTKHQRVLLSTPSVLTNLRDLIRPYNDKWKW